MIARWQWTAIALSLTLAGLVTGLSAVEGQSEWARYQRKYMQLVESLNAASGLDPVQPEIRQIEIAMLNRVDRCTTCHLGVVNFQMTGAPEPFTAHSPLVTSHPPEDYGCTLCHGGEGRAVTTAEAHGDVPGQHARLLPAALRPVTCFICHGTETLPAADTAIVAEGIKLINEYKCLRCHQMDGAGGSVGPDLSTIASQRNWVELYAHLLRPAALVPGSTMPDFGLRRREATAITAFLLTRLSMQERVMDVTYLVSRPTESPIVPGLTPAARSTDRGEETLPTYDGRELFAGLECSVCHRVGLRGGEVGPALTHIGRARDAAWLRDLLTDPARAFSDGQMPEFELSKARVTALVDYLMTLR